VAALLAARAVYAARDEALRIARAPLNFHHILGRKPGKNTLSPRDLECRGGILISNRKICRLATASKCSHMHLLCQLLTNGDGSTQRQACLVNSNNEPSYVRR
jgi:hypothetical protein